MHRAFLLLGAPTASLILVACGPSLAERARDAAPRAIAEHLADARRPSPEHDDLTVPVGAAWNRVVDASRTVAPIARASFADRRLETHWTYASTDRDGVATQTRTRAVVTLRGDRLDTYATEVRAESEQRSRDRCTDPTAWQPAAADAAVFEAAVRRAIDAMSSARPSGVSFASGPASTRSALDAALDARWGDDRDASAATHAHGARSTTSTIGDVVVEVRTTVDGRVVPLDPYEGANERSGVEIDATLAWRGVDGDAHTEWTSADAGALAEDVLARIGAARAVREIPDESPLEPTDAASAEPALPAPTSVANRNYDLFIHLVQLPLRSPDGLSWDVGSALSGLIRRAPGAARVLELGGRGLTELLDVLSAIGRSGRERGAFARLSRRLASEAGHQGAPDIQVRLTLPDGREVALDGPDDQHVAGWSAPITIEIPGDAEIGWEVLDRDPLASDLVERGRFGSAELLAGCGQVCRDLGRDGRLCVELRPAPGSASP
ncbi:MAG: hypothetical protein AB7S26_35820 [Sandaracinaceae bacterium]